MWLVSLYICICILCLWNCKKQDKSIWPMTVSCLQASGVWPRVFRSHLLANSSEVPQCHQQQMAVPSGDRCPHTHLAKANPSLGCHQALSKTNPWLHWYKNVAGQGFFTGFRDTAQSVHLEPERKGADFADLGYLLIKLFTSTRYNQVCPKVN